MFAALSMTSRNTILSAFAFAMGLGVAQAQGNVVSSATAASMTFNDGHIIQYTYDADGRKLKAEYLLSGMHFLDWDVKNVSPAALGEVIERPSLIVKPVTQATVQYCANHVYRNGALERVDNGYGYWADSTYHYNIADYQGNIRAVVAADGILEEVNNYYPYGALMAAGGVQPYKYGGKEVERENGLDWYDSRARWYDFLTGRTPTLDPKADHYTNHSPYLWCAGNPMKYEDRDGQKVELYATTLPGCDLFPPATHTFLVVKDENGNVKDYFAFGSEYDDLRGSYSGNLKKVSYKQDLKIIRGEDSEHLKKIIEITPPEGMSELEFDKAVTFVAKSFGNNKGITYFLAPTTTDITRGNCNTSTSTILLKSGVSKERINEIKVEIPGLSWGFSAIVRPWTVQEQDAAVRNQEQGNFLYNIVGKP